MLSRKTIFLRVQYQTIPFCYNQSVLHFRSFKPNVILSFSKSSLEETKQPRLSLTNLRVQTSLQMNDQFLFLTRQVLSFHSGSL